MYIKTYRNEYCDEIFPTVERFQNYVLHYVENREDELKEITSHINGDNKVMLEHSVPTQLHWIEYLATFLMSWNIKVEVELEMEYYDTKKHRNSWN